MKTFGPFCFFSGGKETLFVFLGGRKTCPAVGHALISPAGAPKVCAYS